MSDIRQHWEQVYRSKSADAVSWYQVRPATSLAFIADSGIALDAPVIDVGGGASTLVDHLLERGHSDITVLDISTPALLQAQARLDIEKARQVHWLAEDVTRFAPSRRYALWHDRAVFHFLVDETAQASYVAAVQRSLAPGGSVVLATFAADGPDRCSGLQTARYGADTLAALFGDGFQRMADGRDVHVTPWGTTQAFTYLRLRRSD
jgi:trans-aconitate methyltransferase